MYTLPIDYHLNTSKRKVDDHTVLNPFTRDSISDLKDFHCPYILATESTEEHFNARKRHYPYATTTDHSKKFRDDGCSIYGEVITPLPVQSRNLLQSPIDAATSNLNYGQVWIDILEQPQEVNKIYNDHIS